MAICRICGAEYKASANTAEQICHNDDCWKRAWNEAVAPFRGGKVHTVTTSKRRRITPYDRELVIKLFKQGRTRRQIHNTPEVSMSYEMVCKTIRDYLKGKEGN